MLFRSPTPKRPILEVVAAPSSQKPTSLAEQVLALLTDGVVLTRAKLRELLGVKNERLGQTLVPEITIVRSLQPGFAQLLEGLPIFPSRSWDVLLSYWPRAGRCRSNEMVGQTCG